MLSEALCIAEGYCVTNLRALRLSHHLSLIELALLCDIPARTLAEIEYGIQRLDYESRARLARAFDLPPEQIWASSAPPQIAHKAVWRQRAVLALAVVLMGGLLLLDSLLNQLPPLRAAPRTNDSVPASQEFAPPRATLRASPSIPSPVPPARPTTSADQPTSTQPAPDAPTIAPRFTLAEDGPHGCPLDAPAAGRPAGTGSVIITQGYGVDTHAPASIWGAVDLAIDGDGDGSADPDATQGVPIFATHSGVAHVTLDSWPGGNFVRVVDEQAGWSSAYAHLDTILITEGQAIPAGTLIGTAGSTGQTSGPHLHYEVWHGDENVDPSGLIECW
jgi:transcriptional regulator with XRE-family HTH domain